MNDFNVSFVNNPYKTKPKDTDAAKLSSTIANNILPVNRGNLKYFANQVGANGCTFCPATFKNSKRTKDNFHQMQLFSLDFDNKDPKKSISFEDVRIRAETYELPILFAYDTFSSKDHDRFRIAFLNDVQVTDIRAAEAMLKALKVIFPEVDLNCIEASRMFYGGKELLYFDDNIPEINIESLFRNMTLYFKNRYGTTNYKRKVTEFAKTTGIGLTKNNQLDIVVIENGTEKIGRSDDKNSPNPYIDTVTFGEKLSSVKYIINFTPLVTNPLGAEKQNHIHNRFRSDTLKDIYSSCRLYNEFSDGHRRLSHEERFGLATNLVQVESGAAKVKEILKRFSYHKNCPKKYDDWNYYLHYIKSYKPKSCHLYCPYYEQCSHGTNILSTVKVSYNRFERLANYDMPLYSVEEAWEDFNSKFAEAVESSDNKWHIIKAQTAMGKTETMLQLLENTHQRVLVVVPTNKLKVEVCERASARGIEIITSPSLHEIKRELPDDIWEDIDDLFKSGKSRMPYIRKQVEENDPECADVFKTYLNDLDAFNKCEGHAITTHRRFLNMDVSKYDLVIVDEDIIFSSIIPNKIEFNISDLKRVQKKLPANNALAGKIRNILKFSKANEFFELEAISCLKKEYADLPMGVDISALCAAAHFCAPKTSGGKSDAKGTCVMAMSPVNFSKDSKYIMLSATVDEQICKYYFGEDNVKFYNCKNAQYTGILKQYANRSMSRADLYKEPSVVSVIKNWSGFKHTISFKKLQQDGLYKGDLYFGNSAGCDYLKGENIDVIGTPHQPEWVYKLFAYSIGLDFDIDAKIKPCNTVTHNGWKFRFTTYEDKVLRDIQFYMIESELEQAVGRARLLRKVCTVNLFSNFPLRQADIRQFDYDKPISF